MQTDLADQREVKIAPELHDTGVAARGSFAMAQSRIGMRLKSAVATTVLSLIESAKLNGHDPWAYLKDVFEWLPR